MLDFEKIRDRIDDYIRGNMSVGDRNIFERELRKNAELRQEVELQASISDAVQVVRLKQLLQQIEVDISVAQEKSRAYSINENDNSILVVRSDYFHKSLLFSISIAVVVVLLFFLGNSWRLTNKIKGFGNEYYAALIEPVSRDGNTLDNLIISCYSLIEAEEYDAAIAHLNEARRLIVYGFTMPIVDEESDYTHKLLEKKQYEVDWYEAIILMRQGKYRKAQKVLKSVAETSSPYANNAKYIMNQMFNVKF